jgi:hypothetical protein
MIKLKEFQKRLFRERISWCAVEGFFTMKIEAAMEEGDTKFVEWLKQLMKEMHGRVFQESNLFHPQTSLKRKISLFFDRF